MLMLDAPTARALKNISEQPDFVEVLRWIVASRDSSMDDLIGVQDPVRVHQLQGACRELGDILRAAWSANPSLGARLGLKGFAVNTQTPNVTLAPKTLVGSMPDWRG